MGNLSKLKTCRNNFEAQLLKGALKAEGIICMLSNEIMSTVYGGLIPDFSHVDVLVSDADLKSAKEIMERANSSDSRSDLSKIATRNVEWEFG